MMHALQNQAPGAPSPTADEDEEEEPQNVSVGTFDYLLSMPIYSLTIEKVIIRQRPSQWYHWKIQSIEQVTANAG